MEFLQGIEEVFKPPEQIKAEVEDFEKAQKKKISKPLPAYSQRKIAETIKAESALPVDLQSQQSLRNAVIYYEILGKPLALRNLREQSFDL